MQYENLFWTSLEKIVEKKMLLIPVGSVEQHGLKLPFGVDSFIANSICQQISKPLDAVVAPVLSYGARSLPNSGGGDYFPGTILIRGSILIGFYEDIIRGYIKAGFNKIIIINAHWENEVFLQEAIESLKNNGCLEKCKILLMSWWSILDEQEVYSIIPQFAGWQFEHAGRAETAIMLHYCPDLVGKDENCNSRDLTIKTNIYTYPLDKQIQNNHGSLSASGPVTVEMGAQLAECVEKNLSSFIRRFLKDVDT